MLKEFQIVKFSACDYDSESDSVAIVTTNLSMFFFFCFSQFTSYFKMLVLRSL